MPMNPNGGFCSRCGSPIPFAGGLCPRCGVFSVPVPPHAPPPAKKHTGAIVAVVVVVLLILLLGALAVVPVDQSSSFNATIVNPGSVGSSYTEVVQLTHPGTVSFSWATTNGGTTTFSVTDPAGNTVYSPGSAASGQGSFQISLLGSYTFAIYDWSPETVQLSGTLSYAAPLL